MVLSILFRFMGMDGGGASHKAGRTTVHARGYRRMRRNSQQATNLRDWSLARGLKRDVPAAGLRRVLHDFPQRGDFDAIA